MLLTIGMIVKNEEKWLDKCLSAIKPILDSVDSELIITDTGSTDKTVEIAKKYTDKILHFDWINDFSAARNTGIENSHGEWFMFLDADEIFQSCDGIINFFNSEEYKKYNSASYIIRNWGQAGKGTTYNDMYAPRMVNLFPETKFENPVHEKLNIFLRPGKVINDIADHYGYLYENEADKLKKFERNSTLLKKRLETEKNNNPFLYIQLYETYNSAGYINEAETYIDKGIELSYRLKSNIIIPLYFYKIYNLHERNDHESVIKYSHDYFELSEPMRTEPMFTDGEIYVLMGDSLFHSGMYAEAAKAFEGYFHIMSLIENERIDTSDKFMLSRCYCDKRFYLIIVNEYIRCCINTGIFKEAADKMCTLPIFKYSENKEQVNELIHLETELIKNTDIKYIERFRKQLDEYGKRCLDIATENIKSKYMVNQEMQELSAILKNNIRNMISAGDNENAKKYLQEYSAMNPDDPEIPELFKLMR